MPIKVIALDIYGTVLATDDFENILPPRKGLKEFLDRCDEKGILVVTASDSDLINLKMDLKESGVDISRFNDFYELKQDPKDFSWIIDAYKIKPEELLVIGDTNKDIDGAIKCNAKYFKVPIYFSRGGSDFDLNSIDFV